MQLFRLITVIICLIATPLASATNIWRFNPTKLLESFRGLFTASSPEPLRVAIIGAGAAGSSAAYWLQLASQRLGVEITVDIYERESYIGGRAMSVHPHGNANYFPIVELGATNFAATDKNMLRAAQVFNLTVEDYEELEKFSGVWDGKKLTVLQDARTGFVAWWSLIKSIWRYGVSSCAGIVARREQVTEQLSVLYQERPPTWDNINDLAAALGVSKLLMKDADWYMYIAGVQDAFLWDVITPMVRAKYMVGLDEVRALAALHNLGVPRHYIAGGSAQIFEGFVANSNASVTFNTRVTGIDESSSRTQGKRWLLKTTEAKALLLPRQGSEPVIKTTSPYAHVIVAAPCVFDRMQYARTHVTVLTTTSASPNPEFFAAFKHARVPTTIFTSHEGLANPSFHFLSYMGEVSRANGTLDGEREWVVMITSEKATEHQWLEHVFGAGKVSWVIRKEWHLFPRLTDQNSRKFPPVKINQGLWYANSLENSNWPSSMEMQIISARNVVERIIEEEFSKDLCGNPAVGEWVKGEGASDEPMESSWDAQGKIWGWDC